MIHALVRAASAAHPFAVANTVGVVAFAFVGATKAAREEFDVFGVTVVGLVTAFVGGATRDVVVGRLPLALQSYDQMALGLLSVALAVALRVALDAADEHPLTLAADAVGLAAFATTGAIVASAAGVTGFGVVALATVNAVGGGACADVLLDRSPFILFEDFYASCAVLGGATYWLLGAAGAAPTTAAACCAAVTVVSRLAAVARGWRLPTADSFDAVGGPGER